MAWTTPPTFTAGAVLSAAQMNIISQDLQHLFDTIGQVNTSFNQQDFADGTTSEQTFEFNQLHRAQYFHWNISIGGGLHDELRISYNGTEIFTDLGARAGPYTWQGHVDLDANPGGLTIGAFYTVVVTFRWTNSANNGTINFLGESGSTTPPV
jgi:hypothetical protein